MSRLACPHCGWTYSDVKRQQMHGLAFWVQCCSCGARGPRCYSKQDAIDGWQMRALARKPEDVRHIETVWPRSGVSFG